MEKTMETAAENIIGSKNIDGVVASDRQGLCILTAGAAESASACNCASLADRAQSLHPDLPAPHIVLNFEGMDVVVKSTPELSLGVVRKKAVPNAQAGQ